MLYDYHNDSFFEKFNRLKCIRLKYYPRVYEKDHCNRKL